MIDIEQLRKYLDCEDEFIIELIDNFLSENRDILHKMESAVVTSDVPVIGALAHKMLSSTRMLKIDNLNEILKKLEHKANKNEPISEFRTLFSTLKNRYTETLTELEELRKSLVD